MCRAIRPVTASSASSSPSGLPSTASRSATPATTMTPSARGHQNRLAAGNKLQGWQALGLLRDPRHESRQTAAGRRQLPCDLVRCGAADYVARVDDVGCPQPNGRGLEQRRKLAQLVETEV